MNSIRVLLLSCLLIVSSIIVLWLKIEEKTTNRQILFLAIFSLIGYVATLRIIAISMPIFQKKLVGRDINKPYSKLPIPEGLGLVSGIVYLVCVIMFQPIFSSMIGEYNAALTSICLMILLGFADDVLDLRWSVKISLSFLATLPILVAYGGPTTIVVPKPLVALLGIKFIHLGLFYHLYMAFVSVFCTNSINILAGVNGLEVGQSIIIGCAVLIHSTIQLFSEGTYWSSILSISLVLPFITTSSALLYYNWYPSRVFVGDTYTYFAGMTLSVVGILGHCSKTLMLFFIPQLINFTISLPQLFGIIPCPRHRLPRFNPETKKLEAVSNHWNLLNAVLFITGPMTEHQLSIFMMIFQVFCCGLGFFVRYHLSTYFYDD